MSGSFQGDWVHSTQLATSEVPVSQGGENCSCRQGPLTPVCLSSGAGRHLAPGTAPRVLGVEVVMNQRQTVMSTSLEGATGAKTSLIRAGQLRAPGLGLGICCHQCLVWIFTGNGTQLSHQLQILPPA